MDVKVFRRIEEIPEQDWNKVYPVTAAENYHFFKTLDALDFRQFRFYYLMVYDNGIPIGATSLFLMDFQLDMGARGIMKRFAKSIKKLFPRILSKKILFCGVITGRGRIGIVGKEQEVVEAVLDNMEKLAAKEKAAALAFKDFDASYDSCLQMVLERGFVRAKSLPTAVMKVDFENFDSYLKGLSSSSREGFRRKFRKMEQNPRFDLEIVETISPEVSREMHRLYLETARDSEVEFEELPVDYFAALCRSMPGSIKCFLWRLEGRLVAFAQCIIRGNYFVDYYLGFDYTVAHRYNLYLVRFKELLEWCIRNKMKFYEIGQSSYEIKRRLGFDFLPLYAYSRPCSKISLPLFKFYHKFMTFEKFEPALQQAKSEGR